jgi:hypothetical protein
VKKNIVVLCLMLFLLLSACDILRSSLFKVVSWTPGDGYHSDPGNIIISFDFSHTPHKSSVERNFTLNEDGNRVRGFFKWEKNKMTFVPLVPLKKNADYTINISTDARDTNGLSMETAFYHVFTTRPCTTRPDLISCFPSMHEEISDLKSQIILEFSLPIPLKSLYDNISFVPSMTGLWRQEDEGKTAVFQPSDMWLQNNRYEIRISSSLTDNNGMNIRNGFSSVFITGADHEIPALLSASRITKAGISIQLMPDRGFSCVSELPVENSGWEKDDRFLLVFSKPVDSLLVRNYTNIENGPNFVMETLPGFKTEFIFRFENTPVYESRFTLRIRNGIRDESGNETKDESIFRIFADGEFSKPPELAGIRIPMAPKNHTDSEPVFFTIDSLYETIPITDENYPSGETVNTWIELYFITAEETLIDVFSLMELFRVETSNNVIYFSPKQIKTSDFTFVEPQSGWEDFQRVEIIGDLRNSTNFGIINFQIAAGLRDNAGNRNENSFNVSLKK